MNYRVPTTSLPPFRSWWKETDMDSQRRESILESARERNWEEQALKKRTRTEIDAVDFQTKQALGSLYFPKEYSHLRSLRGSMIAPTPCSYPYEPVLTPVSHYKARPFSVF